MIEFQPRGPDLGAVSVDAIEFWASDLCSRKSGTFQDYQYQQSKHEMAGHD